MRGSGPALGVRIADEFAFWACEGFPKPEKTSKNATPHVFRGDNFFRIDFINDRIRLRLFFNYFIIKRFISPRTLNAG